MLALLFWGSYIPEMWEISFCLLKITHSMIFWIDNIKWIKDILVEGKEITSFWSLLNFIRKAKTLSEVSPVDFPFLATSSRNGVWLRKSRSVFYPSSIIFCCLISEEGRWVGKHKSTHILCPRSDLVVALASPMETFSSSHKRIWIIKVYLQWYWRIP